MSLAEHAGPVAELHLFPKGRIVRVLPVDETVTVTHRGVTHHYACPSDLHAAVLTARSDDIRAVEHWNARRRIRRYAERLRQRRERAIRADRDIVVRLTVTAVAAGVFAGLAYGVVEFFR